MASGQEAGSDSANQARGDFARRVRPNLGQRKSLVMWSSGLDSTYGLARLLQETDDQVFAHHIHRLARHDSGRRQCPICDYEAEAIERMRPFILANYREFHYSESQVDLTAFSHYARDTITAMFFAAQATKSFGFTPADRILISVNSDEDRDWNPGSEIYEFLRMVTIHFLKLVWRSEEVPHCFLWSPPPTKQEEADYLPYELFRMTASCRSPTEVEQGYATCGRCAECLTLRTVVHHEAARWHEVQDGRKRDLSISAS